MPPTIQSDPGTVTSITGVAGGVSPTAPSATGNVQLFTDNNNTPTYSGIIISSLTASRLVSSDGSNNLVSVTDLTNWVKGTTSRITSTNSSGVATLDISAAYVGQTSITTLGTIATGIWNGTVLGAAYGGTGIANNAASTLAISGNFATTLTVTNTTSVTLPTSGTLVNTGVTALSSLTTVGTIGTGVWQGTVIDGTYINYNTTNLKVTSNKLNTIQDIATSSSPTFADATLTGNLSLTTAGKTLKIASGSNACIGTGATMVNGAVTVSTTAVNAGDIVLVSRTASGGTLGSEDPLVTIVDGTSFTLTSQVTVAGNPVTNTLETSTYSWIIFKAA